MKERGSAVPESRWERMMRRFAQAPKEGPTSKHRLINDHGNHRNATKPIPSRVRTANRKRNKAARASRKRNTP